MLVAFVFIQAVFAGGQARTGSENAICVSAQCPVRTKYCQMDLLVRISGQFIT